jgi:hypothetical protein
VNFTPEEFDLAGLDRKRWNSVNYTLRHDEAIEMADLVEATSLTIGSAILVLGPSLDHEAEQLQDIDWLTSDAEPIDHTGAVSRTHHFLYHHATELFQSLLFLTSPSSRTPGFTANPPVSRKYLHSAMILLVSIGCYSKLI